MPWFHPWFFGWLAWFFGFGAKMLDLNQVRSDFAAYLVGNANTRHSMDAALMHVVERAYQQGLDDAHRIPDAVAAPIADLDGLTQGESIDPLEIEVEICLQDLTDAIRSAPSASKGAWAYALLQSAAQIEHSAAWREFLREALAEVTAHYQGHH